MRQIRCTAVLLNCNVGDFDLTHWPQGDAVIISIKMIKSGHMPRIKFMITSCEFDTCLMIRVQFCSGKSLVPSDNKPLPEPSDLCRHMASLGFNELNVYVGDQHFSQINSINKSDVDVAWPEMGHIHHLFVQWYLAQHELLQYHDNVIKWKPFPRYWPFVWEIHRSPVNSPHKGQWRRALMFSLICVWKTGWVNNREAGELRRYRANYDVIVLII